MPLNATCQSTKEVLLDIPAGASQYADVQKFFNNVPQFWQERQVDKITSDPQNNLASICFWILTFSQKCFSEKYSPPPPKFLMQLKLTWWKISQVPKGISETHFRNKMRKGEIISEKSVQFVLWSRKRACTGSVSAPLTNSHTKAQH